MSAPKGKAMVLHEHGADKLTLVQDFQFAEPKAGEVLVKVAAAGVNPVDGYVRAGIYASPSFPLIIGGDLSGTVVSAGEGSRFKAGDAVFGVSSTYISKAPELQGTYASHCVLKDEWLAAAPKSITLAHAAAAPLAALTAIQALEKAAPAAGQRVLITGASGGVGHIAVQLAKVVHSLHVTAVCSAKHAAWMRELGADAVVDYAPGVEAALKPFADEAQQFDIVIDTIGGEMVDFAAKHCLRKGGIVCELWCRDCALVSRTFQQHESLTRPRRLASLRAAHIMNKGSGDSKVVGAGGDGVRFATTLIAPSGEQAAQVAALIDAGKLKIKVAREYPLEEATAALNEVMASHAGGKVILVV